MQWDSTRLSHQASQQAEPGRNENSLLMAFSRHRCLLQTTALMALARHSSSGHLNLKERLRPLARGKCQGVAQVCSGCGRMPAQPGQQAHEASGTEPLPFSASQRLATGPNGWVYPSPMGTFQSLCPTVDTGRAYQGRHVPSVHLATGDLQLRLRHRAHLEVFWPSSPCPHDGWQGHRAQLCLAYTVKLLLQDG